MSKNIFSKLPDEIIKNILLYDKHFIMRDKKILVINNLVKDIKKENLLKKIPRIFKFNSSSWHVILGNYKRFVLGYNKINNDWEYFFSVYSLF